MKEHTLRPAASLKRVYLYRDFVDFRKSYKGLSAIVEQEIGHDPFLCVELLYVAASLKITSKQLMA